MYKKRRQNYLTIQGEAPPVRGPVQILVMWTLAIGTILFTAFLQLERLIIGKVTYCKRSGIDGLEVFETDPHPESVTVPLGIAPCFGRPILETFLFNTKGLDNKISAMSYASLLKHYFLFKWCKQPYKYIAFFSCAEWDTIWLQIKPISSQTVLHEKKFIFMKINLFLSTEYLSTESVQE